MSSSVYYYKVYEEARNTFKEALSGQLSASSIAVSIHGLGHTIEGNFENEPNKFQKVIAVLQVCKALIQILPENKSPPVLCRLHKMGTSS